MRPQTKSQTGVGASSVLNLDANMCPFTASLSVVVSGTVTYDVEITFDGTNFFDTVLAAETDNQMTSLDYPALGARLNVTAGSGTATLTVIQAG